MNRNHEELATKARQGDDQAFEALVRIFQKPLFGFVYRLAGDRDTAMDITQETFVKAYFALNRLRRDSSFQAWLYRIAANTYRNNLRYEAKRRHLSLEMVPPPTDEISPAGDDREPSRLLAEAVKGLPLRQREIVVLRVQEGYKFDEAARIMGCSVGAAKASYYQAVKKIKQTLGKGEEH